MLNSPLNSAVGSTCVSPESSDAFGVVIVAGDVSCCVFAFIVHADSDVIAMVSDQVLVNPDRYR